MFIKSRNKQFINALDELSKIEDIQLLKFKVLQQLEKLCSYNLIRKKNIVKGKEDRVDNITKKIYSNTTINLDELIPVEISGDGNCFYRSLGKALYSNEAVHAEIRYRIVADLILNFDRYLSFNNSIEEGIYRNFTSPSSKYTSEPDVIFLEEIKRATNLNSWSSSWHIFGAAQALKVDINEYHPKISKGDCLFKKNKTLI